MASIFDNFFGDEPKPPTNIESWATQKYLVRARSKEARTLVRRARRTGQDPSETLIKFHKANWPTVVREAAQQFSPDQAEPLYRDHDTQVRALGEAVKILFPHAHPGPIISDSLDHFRGEWRL